MLVGKEVIDKRKDNFFVKVNLFLVNGQIFNLQELEYTGLAGVEIKYNENKTDFIDVNFVVQSKEDIKLIEIDTGYLKEELELNDVANCKVKVIYSKNNSEEDKKKIQDYVLNLMGTEETVEGMPGKKILYSYEYKEI